MGLEYCAPILAMVVVEVGLAGLNVVTKLAMDSGMSPFVLIVYRQIIATVALSPVAFFRERRTRSKITGRVLFHIFLISIFGATLNQMLYYTGLKYSSTTISSALTNMLPAITFIIAIPFRVETVGIKTRAGQAKVMGTILCVVGSMLMTFYKGSAIRTQPSGVHWKYAEIMTQKRSNGEKMVLGAFLVIGSTFACACWFIIQAKTSQDFVSPYTSTALMCLMASIECLIIGAGVERSISKWALGWDIRLVAALYTGIAGSAVSYTLISWCIQRRGPLFVAMFNPLMVVMVALFEWAFMDEKLHVGSVVGSALIVVGLYSVLWGKGDELQKKTNVNGKIMNGEDEVEGSAAADQP